MDRAIHGTIRPIIDVSKAAVTMSESQWLQHPELGELAAQRLLDCIFALAPSGRILHFHVEQCELESRDGEIHFCLNGAPASEERSRCQIIPPLVPAFRGRSQRSSS
jgi:hypothetical protein